MTERILDREGAGGTSCHAGCAHPPAPDGEVEDGIEFTALGHYLRAGELLAAADGALGPGQTRTDVIAAAAVHAKLAEVGVLALRKPGGALPAPEYFHWLDVTGVEPGGTPAAGP